MSLLLDFIVNAGIIAIIIILFLILKQRSKQLPQLVLIVFFTVLLCIVINLYSSLHQLNLLFYITYIPHNIALWVFGPLLFIYIKSLFLKTKDVYENLFLIFGPTLFYLLIFSIPSLLYQITGIYLFDYLKTYYNNSLWVANINDLYLIIYLIICHKFLSKYVQKIKANYANLSKNDLNWINQLLIGGILIISLDLIMNLYQIIFNIFKIESGIFTLVALILFIFYLGYYGLNQSKILLPDFLFKKDNFRERNAITSDRKDNEMSVLKLKLESVLEEEKPYLDNELTLIKLADLISTTDKKLSTLLNQYMNISFYDLINSYRVKAVKEKIDSGYNSNYTLLAIAYECGFNSKASFNRVFKKETGVSPSAYKNQ
ncbi:helix-turn-helix domain-containing protein [Flavobacteriaceae bacterium AU392]|nr:AraC family transcriptional regulator [Flavobacteriaceae bacterium]RKM83544.1 helix-turn-helix domain-containing protein [Flavobacteriaceae bacterium AU392]